jgi:hypothetical protein
MTPSRRPLFALAKLQNNASILHRSFALKIEGQVAPRRRSLANAAINQLNRGEHVADRAAFPGLLLAPS